MVEERASVEPPTQTPERKLRNAAAQEMAHLDSGIRVVESRLEIASQQVDSLRQHLRRLQLRKQALQCYESACELETSGEELGRTLDTLAHNVREEGKGEIPW